MSTDNISFQEAWERARPHIEALNMAITATLDQVMAAWRDCEPILRAWVTEADKITEQQWMDMPESTRDFYDSWKAFFERWDAASGAAEP